MDIITDTETTESPSANGTSTQVEVKMTTVKPWIAAGFKSRAEMRAAKAKEAKDKVYAEGMGAIREKMSKPKAATKKKPAKAKSTKPVKKAAVKAKVKAAAKAKSTTKTAEKDGRKTPAAPKKGMVKDGSQEPVAMSELSARCKKVFLAVRKGATATLGDIIDKAFPSLPHAKASSTTRNQLRFLRIHGMFKLLGDGEYKRVV